MDSRTILDQLGAENLLGSGDMLFMPPGTSKLTRIHGPYVSEKEIERIVDFAKKQAMPAYDESISEYHPDSTEGEKRDEEFDEKYDEAVDQVFRAAEADDVDLFWFQRGIFLARTFLGFTPSEGPTTPSASMRSIMRAALL